MRYRLWALRYGFGCWGWSGWWGMVDAGDTMDTAYPETSPKQALFDDWEDY